MSAILYKDNPYGGTTSVTDAGHVLVTEGSDTTTAQAKFNTQTTAIQRILGNFATVEQSTTASKAYNVGDYLVLNSFLYKVTQVIAAGDTIDNTQNGNVEKTNAGAEFKNANSPVREMTKAQYDALPESVKNDGTIYLITDGTGGWEAENASYDNTESGLTATNVQDALDEVVSYSALTFSDYFTVSSGFTINGGYLIKVAPHLAYFHLDMTGTFGAGQTIFGSCVTGKIKEACYVAGRCSMGGSAYPASGVFIPGGQMRIYCQGASTSAVLNGYVFI